jgi:hypothetical protein
MSEEMQPVEEETTQKTLKGHTIPVPSRKDVMDAFAKITKPEEPAEDEKPEKG